MFPKCQLVNPIKTSSLTLFKMLVKLNNTTFLIQDGLLASTNDTDSDEGYFPAYNDIRLPFANPPPPRDHTLKPIKRFFSKCHR